MRMNSNWTPGRRAFLMAGAALAHRAKAVEPGKPSRTSLLAAAGRAISSRDPNPQTRCPDSMAARLIRREDLDSLTGSNLPALYDQPWDEVVRALGRYPYLNLTLRTMHIDARIRAAVAEGLEELIILGAGLDSRAYRMAKELAKVRVFEVDYPPTQEFKKRRVMAALGKAAEGVTYAGIDFSTQTLEEVLAAAGHRPRAKVLFVMEAVTMYLTADAVSSTLKFVSKNTAPGGGIVFDYYDRRLLDGEGHTPRSKADAALYRSWGEPQIFGIPAYDSPQFAQQHGLALRSDHTLGELCLLYTPTLDPASMNYRRLYYHIAHAVVA